MKRVVFTTYEDVGRLTEKGLKSQVIGYGKGAKPQFEGMKEAKKYAQSLNIQVVHMITSYLDQVRTQNHIISS